MSNIINKIGNNSNDEIERKYSRLTSISSIFIKSLINDYLLVNEEFQLETSANNDIGIHYVKRNSNGTLAISTVHGLYTTSEWCLEDTHHHYTDIWSNELFSPLTNILYIGSVNVTLDELQSHCVSIDNNQEMLLWSYDGKKLLYQLCKTFKSERRLIAGTPIYNANKQMCSVVTGSYDDYYTLSGFYGIRGRITTNCVTQLPLDINQPINYAHRSFQNKDSLVKYIQKPDENINGLFLRANQNQIRIINVENGLEKAIMYFECKIIKQFQ